MYAIGVMPMPADFKYLEVLRKGKPKHDRLDDFSVRHPKMDCGKRAKIFAPFDALRGFNFAISRKEVLYVDRPELSCEDERELNRRLDILHNLTFNSRMARQNAVFVTVTRFVVCADQNHEAYGKRGQLHMVSGICRYVDPDVAKTIRIGGEIIAFKDILKIESPGDIFSTQWGDLFFTA